MGNLTINAIFALVFAGIAWNSLPHGWRFFKIGWLAFRANAEKPDTEFNVEQQRGMQVGSNFLVAGLAWLIAGLIAASLTIMFIVFAILGIGIFDLIS